MIFHLPKFQMVSPGCLRIPKRMRTLIKMQDELGEIKSYNFNSKLLVAIDARWLDYFDSKNPTFKAVIQTGKYVLVGPKVNRSGPTSNPLLSEVDDSE